MAYPNSSSNNLIAPIKPNADRVGFWNVVGLIGAIRNIFLLQNGLPLRLVILWSPDALGARGWFNLAYNLELLV